MNPKSLPSIAQWRMTRTKRLYREAVRAATDRYQNRQDDWEDYVEIRSRCRVVLTESLSASTSGKRLTRQRNQSGCLALTLILSTLR